MKKLDKAALQMQKLAGIITESEYNTEMAKMNKMKSTPKMEEAKVLHVDDIDFKDDGNRDSIFTVEASEEDIQNFEEGNVETVFEDNEYGGTFGVYKLPTGEYMYAFPDAEAYAKTPKGVKIVDSAASMNEMNKMKRTPKMEAEGSGANTYKVVEIGSRGEEEGEEMMKSDLSIKEFCEELLKKAQAEILAMNDSAEERAEILRHFKEFSSVGEYDDKWEVSVTEETGYDVYTEDQAASMNEMNKMKRKSRM